MVWANHSSFRRPGLSHDPRLCQHTKFNSGTAHKRITCITNTKYTRCAWAGGTTEFLRIIDRICWFDQICWAFAFFRLITKRWMDKLIWGGLGNLSMVWYGSSRLIIVFLLFIRRIYVTIHTGVLDSHGFTILKNNWPNLLGLSIFRSIPNLQARTDRRTDRRINPGWAGWPPHICLRVWRTFSLVASGTLGF